MAHIPEPLRLSALDLEINKAGLPILHVGKVRNSFQIPDFPYARLVRATDRISVFDFVLNALIPGKGSMLTLLTHFWLQKVLPELQIAELRHHLLAAGAQIDVYLPKELQGNPQLRRTALVVRNVDMLPVECIARGFLTGSAYKEYKAKGTVWGKPVASGLVDGSPFPAPIFTPTTKAEQGHDEPISAESVRDRFGPKLESATLTLFNGAYEFLRARGLFLADTKFEFGTHEGQVYLADEVLTPDSSRFWPIDFYVQAMNQGAPPPNYDKEVVRQVAKKWTSPFGATIDKLDPENPAHVSWVQAQALDQRVIEQTISRYTQIAHTVTQIVPEDYFASELQC